MACPDVVVVGTAVEREVPGGGGLATVGVVRNFVGAKNVGVVMDLGIAVQFVNVAVFFLFDGADRGLVLVLVCGLAGAG